MTIELNGPAECSPTARCATLQNAIDQGYLTVPVYLDNPGNRAPALIGPLHTPRGKRRKPMLVMQYCCFCGYKFGHEHFHHAYEHTHEWPSGVERLTAEEVAAISVAPTAPQPASTAAQVEGRWSEPHDHMHSHATGPDHSHPHGHTPGEYNHVEHHGLGALFSDEGPEVDDGR